MNGDTLFLAPEHLGWLVLVPFFVAFTWVAGRNREGRLRAVVGATRLRELSAEWSRDRRKRRLILASCGLAAAALALAQPTWGEPEPPPAPRGTDLVLCLDVSRSMRARDLAASSRLTRAREEISELVDQLGGDRLGLVVFAGEAKILSPLTRDADAIATLATAADELSVGRGGTDLGAAIELARGMFRAAESERAAIVVLSDGEDHGGGGRAAAQAAREAGLRVHCIGLGTEGGAKIPLDPEEGGGFLRDASGVEVVTALLPADLRSIAEAGGGLYVDAARGRRVLATLWRGRVAGQKLATSSAGDASGTRPQPANRYFWPLLLALIFWALDFSLTERGSRS
jgi:Ca-activated chloride channel homolog